ncbi:hypothetical protein JKI95_04785 [Corynebacterium aquatimens]|uniref:DUF6541 family protein n=1 Tax=Corynebacterium TaxID=1716 RepID=UPI001F2F34EA|nr:MULTISPECIES: DUF6541 family protein [Corynebacterium]QYH20235.1 hypothetical protein JKI95_04785 [Corynebacterium aquatimens]UIZ92501.1 hypothetical protein JZY91_01440 [Corynebacterium sp. CNCTC7651]
MTTAAAACFAVAFFLIPGFLVALVSGLRVPAAAAAALPVTFGVIGMSAWMWGLTSAPFNLWTYGVSVALAIGAAVLWRYLLVKRPAWTAPPKVSGAELEEYVAKPWWRRGFTPELSWILPALGVVAGSWMLVADRLGWLVRAPHGTYNIVQGWDVQWHANLVRFIMDTGVASPTRMGELQNIETHTQLLYPSAYHAGIALFGEAAGLDPIPALNIAQAVLPGVALPLTMACLVFAFMRSTGVTAQIAAAFAAAAIYAVPQVAWIPDYVGMWPYLFAMSLTGIVVWQFVATPRTPAGALPAALGFLGVLTAHPSAVTVVVLCVALSWLTSTLVRPVRSRLVDTLWIGLPAIGGTLAFLPQIFAGSEQAEEVSGWEASEAAAKTDAWASSFFMDTRHVSEFFPNFDPTIALWLALAGALVLVFFRGQVWPVLFYLVSLAAAANSTQPLDGWVGRALAMIGNVHYNTPHRLILPVAMCVVAAAAIGVAAALRLITLAPLAARKTSTAWTAATTAASVALAAGIGAVAAPQLHAAVIEGAQRAYVAPREDGRMVNDDDLAAFAWLASQPAAFEGTTLGDPADGHSWLYAVTGVPTVSRHYLWPAGGSGADTALGVYESDSAGEGLRGAPGAANAIDRALAGLKVKFYITSPGSFWYWQHPLNKLDTGMWTAEGTTPVYRKGQVVIFAVNEEFTAAELEALQQDALEHGSEPLDSPRPAESAAAG